MVAKGIIHIQDGVGLQDFITLLEKVQSLGSKGYGGGGQIYGDGRKFDFG